MDSGPQVACHTLACQFQSCRHSKDRFQKKKNKSDTFLSTSIYFLLLKSCSFHSVYSDCGFPSLYSSLLLHNIHHIQIHYLSLYYQRFLNSCWVFSSKAFKKFKNVRYFLMLSYLCFVCFLFESVFHFFMQLARICSVTYCRLILRAILLPQPIKCQDQPCFSVNGLCLLLSI